MHQALLPARGDADKKERARPLLRDQPQRYRTLFISDVHLGARACQAQALLDFLRDHEADTVYLIGDIIDGWALRKSWYWPQAHNDVVQKILRKARKGARIIYLPGNHDEFLRDYYGTHFGGIEVAAEAMHETADGRRFLVIHGDQFDFVIRHARWLAYLGDWAYDVALFTNRWVGAARRKLGLSYWSLSAWAKLKVKNAVNVISKFEDQLILEAGRRGANGVICGHIHHATQRELDGVTYVNTGDWVESCSAVVEHHDGRLEIVRRFPDPAVRAGRRRDAAGGTGAHVSALEHEAA
jgi:UDP-2,3-diacylglucosamine pyrophosphatase LpxH